MSEMLPVWAAVSQCMYSQPDTDIQHAALRLAGGCLGSTSSCWRFTSQGQQPWLICRSCAVMITAQNKPDTWMEQQCSCHDLELSGPGVHNKVLLTTLDWLWTSSLKNLGSNNRLPTCVSIIETATSACVLPVGNTCELETLVRQCDCLLSSRYSSLSPGSHKNTGVASVFVLPK